MIQAFWREIAQTGVRTGLAPTEVQKIRLLNSIAFIGSLTFGLYLPIFLVLQIKSAIFTTLLGDLLALLPIYFNHIGKYVLARFFFCIAMSMYLATIGIIFGEAVGMEHTLFAMGTIPAIFFNKRRHIFGLILFTMVLFTLVKFSFYVVNPLIKHPIFSYFYSINVIITFSLLFITITGFKQEHESYEKMIEKKNENITDSLKYAQRIQKAILGNEEEVLCNFKEGFIFFKPRDIVSGDFFWFSQLFFNTEERSSKRILIAADCTGHGVPGAFMTVMGNALLDEIINEKCITTPHLILHELDRKIVATLQKQNFNQSDGMDMVILVIEEKDDNTKWVHWAGAKNPLYYVRNRQLHEIKGDKFPIGGNQSKIAKTFNTHTFELKDDYIFYLFTDGFQDQFGGKENRKYMVKHFRNFLFEISHLPLSVQKEKLEQEFTSWKGEREQTDDVLVIGVSV
ncbi:PP2C family protein-serine/threonine phosphatase [Thermoflexibacter ruber]|uniref:Serine phosphatase RsbU, regulator of sigma subunit n=1 Tax=Thermoflexibacter ruber TaxID=1003 RepID=A0A1I2JTR1_9BACT|nr:SpoIIE family protein phosphatase [Thermoflexibacter ruber]SFF57974.1 Serine phosphatase RsbU, regulator of sigma subunit [Thermoflexibacter ruber]